MQLYERMLVKFGDFIVRSKAANIGFTDRTWSNPSDNSEWKCTTIPSTVKLELAINRAKFTIGWDHHVQLINALGTALEWFFDEKKKDLFVKSDTGQLYFNNDYNDLKTSAYSGKYTHSFLEIRPVVVERDDLKRYEGVIIVINETDNYACLTVDELLSLSHIIANFDFSRELILYMLMARWTDSPTHPAYNPGTSTPTPNRNPFASK